MFHFMESRSVMIWKEARMFEACSDQILEFRRQGVRKHTNRAQFLELSHFIETMVPYWSRVHACRYSLISESSPIHLNFKLWKNATSTRAVLKQNLSMKSTNYSLYLGAIQTWHVPFWNPALSHDIERGKDVWGCLRHVVTKFWSLNRRQGGGKYTHRVQFLELFESFWFYRDRRLQRPNLQKIRTTKNCKALVFCEGLPIGIWNSL